MSEKCVRRVIMIRKIAISLLFLMAFINNITGIEDFQSKCILLYSIETDSNLYEKNSNQVWSPASLTKIMTFIVVDKFIDDKNERVMVDGNLLKSLDGTDSSLAYLKAGNQYSVQQLLAAMMIPSGNDAALILANYVERKLNLGENGFVREMNEMAKSLGCTNTHFENPHGLYHENHFTTCVDMLKIIKRAIKIDLFNSIVCKNSYELDGKILKNTNKLLDPSSEYYFEDCFGIKTGSHNQAGYCLSSIAKRNKQTYICICMGAPKFDSNGNPVEKNFAMIDSKELYNWAFSKYRVLDISSKISKYFEIQTKYFEIPIKLKECNSLALVPYGKNLSSLDVKCDVSEISEYSLPIKQGQKLGNIKVLCDGKVIKNCELSAECDVSLNFWNKFRYLFKKFVS